MHCKRFRKENTPVEFLYPGRVLNPTLFIQSAQKNRKFIALISEFVTRFYISIILRKTMKWDRYVVFEHSFIFCLYSLKFNKIQFRDKIAILIWRNWEVFNVPSLGDVQ